MSTIIKSIGDDTIGAIERNLPRTPSDLTRAKEGRAPEVMHELRSAHTGVIVSVDVPTIVDLATRHNMVVELAVSIGEFVPLDAVILKTSEEVDERTARHLLRCLKQATERSLEQDVAYGFRELTDIALRALSPAMNDPTTAMNVIDAERDLLRRVGKCPDEEGSFYDDAGALRFVMRTTRWADYLCMLFVEVGSAGEEFPRIRGRLGETATELIGYLPGERASDVKSVAARWLEE